MPIARIAALALLLSTSMVSNGRTASEKVAYTFGPYAPPYAHEPASGRNPDSGLLSTEGGRVFYGTAEAGGLLADGSGASGTLFKISRSSIGGADFTVLHSFDLSTEGGIAEGVPATDGVSLFGALDAGPGSGLGSIYQWTPAPGTQTGGTLTILHTFGGPGDGRLPTGTLCRGADGTLYGTTTADSVGFNGTVFALTPPTAGQTGWTYSILHIFTGADGSQPQGGLVQDGAGILYGATVLGGSAGRGTVFTLAPPAPGQSDWVETTIASLGGTGAPASASTPLLFDAAGAIYAGSAGGALGYGTVFKLTPPTLPGAAWTLSILFTFSGFNGYGPGSLIAGSNGTLYGTTQLGGLHNQGTVFSLAPPAVSGGLWQETDLADFAGGKALGGEEPFGGVVFTANGDLAGTTYVGGLNNTGVIYLVKP